MITHGMLDTARSPESIDFDSFNWFGYSFYDYSYDGRISIRGAGSVKRRSARILMMELAKAMPAPAMAAQAEEAKVEADAYLHGDV